MSALSSAELTEMRAALEDLMLDTCNLLTSTSVADGYGGETLTWGTTVASVPCRADRVSGREIFVGGRLEPFTGYVFSMPHDTAIQITDQIEFDTNKYNIVSINDDQSWMAVLRVYGERI